MIRKVHILIIGSGPAGCTAAIYAARANLSPILIQGLEPGGQLTTTTDVENYPGFTTPIQGPWLMEQMLAQCKNAGTELIYDYVIEVDFSSRPFLISTEQQKFLAEVVIISTGAQAKWLGLPSETAFRGYGVSACATCDGVLYKNKRVLVVGGGNTAVEEAMYLTRYASEVILIHRRNTLRAEKIMQQKLFSHTSVKILWNTELAEVIGTDIPKSVTGVLLKNLERDSTTKINIDGIFIAIGHSPNTSLFKKFLDVDNEGYIITKPNSTKTNIDGVFAAGDVQDKIFRQAATAVGTGCMAALEAIALLET